MIGTIVTPMERGQITLPKEYRDKLGITPKTHINVTLEEDKIVLTPLNRVIDNLSSYVIKPKVSRKEYVKILKKIKGVYWTKSDDLALKRMRAKEKKWDW